MVNKRFNFLHSCWACCIAIQAGAAVVCVGTMILDSGPLSMLEGLVVWIAAQPIILFFAFFAIPVGALLRMLLGLNFDNPRPVALTAGTATGIVLALLFAGLASAPWQAIAFILPLGTLAGLIGGWVWWRVEKRWFEAEHQP